MMNQRGRVVLAVMMLLTAAGCGTSASVRQVRVERVDQNLEGGNRGYLIGAPPGLADRGTPTRGITELEVQLPSGRRSPARRRAAPKPAAAAPSMDETAAEEASYAEYGMGTIEFAPPSGSADEQAAMSESDEAAPAPARQYTVKKGDSLWKIAKQFYGDPYQWRRIYDANRKTLSHPNRVRPGMTLHIPMEGALASAGRPGRDVAVMESDLK